LVELAAQPGDVHLDDVGVTLEVEVPDVVEKLALGDDRARVAGEVLEDRELAGGQLERLTGS